MERESRYSICLSTKCNAWPESLDKRFIAVGTSHGGYLIDKREPLHPRRFFYPEQYPEKDINLFVNSMAFQDSRHI